VISLIAFAAGFSIYFFLDDPSPIPSTTHGNYSISPRVFIASKLISTELSGPNAKLLKFAAPRSFLAAQSTDAFDPIWSVYIKDDDIQVERAYTPLMGVDGDGNLLFWIKKYPKGEVGRWLHSKIPGDSIEMRGPLKTWLWKEGAYDEVVMVNIFSPYSVFFLHVLSC
jgi:cytochrome-b5 reductase